MRIEAYTKVQQIYKREKTAATSATKKTNSRDALELSKTGKDIQTAKNAVASTPDVRDDVVTSLKNSINSGTYDVTGASFADKLLAKYDQTI